eukprot:scaffold19625_cov102-Isochrysis_galbana.AAC.1
MCHGSPRVVHGAGALVGATDWGSACAWMGRAAMGHSPAVRGGDRTRYFLAATRRSTNFPELIRAHSHSPWSLESRVSLPSLPNFNFIPFPYSLFRPLLREDGSKAACTTTAWPEVPTGKVLGRFFVFAKIFGRNCEDFRGVRLLGFWVLGRHAVPSICTGKTIGRVFSKDHPIFRTCCAAVRGDLASVCGADVDVRGEDIAQHGRRSR